MIESHELSPIETSHSLRSQARRMLEAPTLVRTSVCTEGTDPRCGETPETLLMYLSLTELGIVVIGGEVAQPPVPVWTPLCEGQYFILAFDTHI